MEIKVKSHRNILYRTSIKGHIFWSKESLGSYWFTACPKKINKCKGASADKNNFYKMISNSVYFQQSCKVSYDFLSPKEKLVKNIKQKLVFLADFEWN